MHLPVGAQHLIVETLHQLQGGSLRGARVSQGECDPLFPCQLVEHLGCLAGREGPALFFGNPVQQPVDAGGSDGALERGEGPDPLQVPCLELKHLLRAVKLPAVAVMAHLEDALRPSIDCGIQLRHRMLSAGDAHGLIEEPRPVHHSLPVGQVPDRQRHHPGGIGSLAPHGEPLFPFQLKPGPLHGGPACLEAPLEIPGQLLLRDRALRVPGLQRGHLVKPGMWHPGEKPLCLPLFHLIVDLLAPGGKMIDERGIDPLQLDVHLGAILNGNLETALGEFVCERLPVQTPQQLLILEEEVGSVGPEAAVRRPNRVHHEDVRVQLRIDVP